MAEQIEEHVILAYALGELDGEELRRVEDAVAADDELQKLVDEFRELGVDLIDTLKDEPMPSLTDDQRKAIDEEARRFVERSAESTPWNFAAMVAAAAMVFLAIAIPIVRMYSRWQAESHKIAGGITPNEKPAKPENPLPAGNVQVRVVVAGPRPSAVTSVLKTTDDEGALTPTAMHQPKKEPQQPIIDKLPEGLRKKDRKDAIDGLIKPIDNLSGLPRTTYVINLPNTVGRVSIPDLGKLLATTARVPKPDEVAIAPLINGFDYAHPFEDLGPFGIYAEEGACPWDPTRRLVMIAARGSDAARISLRLQLLSAAIGSYRLLGVDQKPLADTPDFKAKPGVVDGVLTLMCEVTPNAAWTADQKIGALVVSNGESELLVPVKATGRGIEAASRTFRLAAAMGAYGMLVKNPDLRTNLSFAHVRALFETACDAKQADQVAMQMLIIQTSKLAAGSPQ